MKYFLSKNKVQISIITLFLLWIIVSLFININNTPVLKKYDAISIMFYVLSSSSLRMLSILAPIIIIILSTNTFHKNIKTGNIKYKLTRMNYRTYIRKNIIRAYKYSFIFVGIMIIYFCLCCLINHNFDFQNIYPQYAGKDILGRDVYYGTLAVINLKFYDTPLLLMLTFFLVIFLHLIFYTNIGLIMCKRNKNFIVTVISSFLVFMAVAIISELIDIYIVSKFNITILNDVFNILGIWIYSDINHLLPIAIYAIILSSISLIILLKAYKHKEEVLINSEK